MPVQARPPVQYRSRKSGFVRAAAPEQDCAVCTAAGKASIRQRQQGVNIAPMPLMDRRARARPYIPDAQGPVCRAAGQLAIGQDSKGADVGFMSRKRARELARIR